MAGRLGEEFRTMHNGAALRVVSPEHHPPDPRVADRPGAHGARLQGHHQGQVRQAIVAKLGGRSAHGGDLGVGGGVMGRDRAVAGGRDHLAGAGIQDHRPDRRFARLGCGARGVERQAHHAVVLILALISAH